MLRKLQGIQILNRYVSNGINTTLVTLTVGVIIAIALEFSFRQIRNRLAKGISSKPDQQLAMFSFGVLATARASSLDQLPPGQQREMINGVENIRNACNPINISTILDLPFALLFLGVLYLLTPELGMIATAFAIISFLVGILLTASLRRPTQQLIETGRHANLITLTAIQESDSVRAFNAGNFLARAWQFQLGFSKNLMMDQIYM